MSAWLVVWQIALVVAVTGLVPWIGIRMLAGSLAASPLAQRTNFRGREVFIGLGIVWVFWVGGMVVLRYVGEIVGSELSLFVAIGAVSPLVIATLLFGVLDDAYGTSAERGFRGHLTALAHGRLTTGAFKLVGIALVSLAAATSIVGGEGVAVSGPPTTLAALLPWAGWTLVLGAVISLSANFINLTDLRPGRALKCYALLAVVLVAVALATRITDATGTALLALALGGPAAAVWALDIRERGMLGDAGANAAGALLGFVAAWECGRSPAAIALLVVLLAVNLASERWSFSRLIERNPLLSWLDNVGRLPHDATASANSAKSSPQSETSDG